MNDLAMQLSTPEALMLSGLALFLLFCLGVLLRWVICYKSELRALKQDQREFVDRFGGNWGGK
jgi:hypothetical protein